jgi:hypothetical protein
MEDKCDVIRSSSSSRAWWQVRHPVDRELHLSNSRKKVHQGSSLCATSADLPTKGTGNRRRDFSFVAYRSAMQQPFEARGQWPHGVCTDPAFWKRCLPTHVASLCGGFGRIIAALAVVFALVDGAAAAGVEATLIA